MSSTSRPAPSNCKRVSHKAGLHMGKPAVSVRILTCTAVTARSRLTRDRSIAAVESKLRQIGLTRPHKQEALRESFATPGIHRREHVAGGCDRTIVSRTVDIKRPVGLRTTNTTESPLQLLTRSPVCWKYTAADWLLYMLTAAWYSVSYDRSSDSRNLRRLR